MPLGDFFYFTKSDRIATIFIVSLVIILAVTSYFVVCSGDDFFVGTPADSTAVAGGKALGAGENIIMWREEKPNSSPLIPIRQTAHNC